MREHVEVDVEEVVDVILTLLRYEAPATPAPPATMRAPVEVDVLAVGYGI
jgi:hypothetical protein